MHLSSFDGKDVVLVFFKKLFEQHEKDLNKLLVVAQICAEAYTEEHSSCPQRILVIVVHAIVASFEAEIAYFQCLQR